MKTLEKEQDKIQQICDSLRRETLEPAKKESEQIISSAKEQAAEIIRTAKETAEKLINEAQRKIQQEHNVFQSSLSQATKQSLEAVRQAIESRLFNPELQQVIKQNLSEPAVIANLITAIIKGLEKEGLAADLTVSISKSVNPQQVNAILGESILNKLKTHSVSVEDIGGGVKVRLEGKRITLDISNIEIEELLKQYIRKDFRKMLFAKDS